MDTTQLLKGVLDLTVLAVVDDEDGYGYDIVRRLRDRGLDDVGDASVYGTLRRLYAGGALTSYVVASETGPHRKYYGITPAGRTQLKQQRDDWTSFSTTVTEDPRRSQRMNYDPDHPRRSGSTSGPSASGSTDLTEEEREELVGGLDADLNDLVEERGDRCAP